MLRQAHLAAHRVTAFSVALALVVVGLGLTGAFAAGPGVSEEPCFDCPGCDSEECHEGEGLPLNSHHHCCTTSCLSHAPAALSSARAAAPPVLVGPMVRTVPVAVTSRAPETPYRPPRV